MQSNKKPQTPQIIRCWADSSLNPTGLQGTRPGWIWLPKVPANCSFKAETPCSGQQVKNNLKAHIPWERAQGWEGRNSHSWVTHSDPAAIGICWSQRSWLNPSVSHGEGAASAADPGQVPGPLGRAGAGGQDWSVLPQPSCSRQSPAQPAPCGGWSSFPRLHAWLSCWLRLWGLAEPQLPVTSSPQPRPRGQPVPRRGSRGSSFPTARHTGHGVPGNFVQFPSLQGLWGKLAREEAVLHSLCS